jgi:hypothetical protein
MVQEQAITAVASVADSAEKEFVTVRLRPMLSLSLSLFLYGLNNYCL